MSSIPPRNEFLDAALDLAHHNWAVLPLWPRGKNPRIPNPHAKGSWERKNCHGECGKWGHGFYDATTYPAVIAYWWGVLYPGANIGARVPENIFVLDIDPRNGGHESLAELLLKHGPLPETLTTISGRGDGGTHYFYRKPPGELSAERLGPGIDIKTSAGYTVHAPSIHPDSGNPYTRIDRPVVNPSDWLIKLIVEPEPVVSEPRSFFSSFWSSSIADEFGETTSWAEILEPHGWRCLDADSDADDAIWYTPTTPARARPQFATGACSCIRPTHRSRLPSRQILTATPSFVHTRSSITTMTCLLQQQL